MNLNTIELRNRIWLICFLSIFHCTLVLCQECNCLETFDFVCKNIELNNPAYQDLTLTKDLTLYTVKKSEIRNKILDKDNPEICLKSINSLLRIIKDHHTSAISIIKNKEIKSASKINDERLFEFKILQGNISYLILKSFNHRLTNSLNNFYDSIDPFITKNKILIIDLRDNQGGSDDSYSKLLRYVYSRPLNQDVVEVWNSSENQKYYKENFKDNGKLINKLVENPYDRFVAYSSTKPTKIKIKNIPKYPEKVIILQNSKVASSAEDFILYSKQGSKVITMGENTGGYTGYGNVRAVRTPCKDILLQTSTSRYRNGRNYEFIGIAPDIILQKDEDWVKVALNYI